jgi:hypothetical protein
VGALGLLLELYGLDRTALVHVDGERVQAFGELSGLIAALFADQTMEQLVAEAAVDQNR